MTILVDARPWIDPAGGGVTRVASGLIPALLKAMPDGRFIFLTTGMRKPALPIEGLEHRHLWMPNKVWSALTMLGFASLGDLNRSYRSNMTNRTYSPLLLLPNLGFVGSPRLPYALLVHDISFLIEPSWFSPRANLWHTAVHAKRLIRGARILFAVSERTKQDLVERLGIEPTRITVLPLGLPVEPRTAALPDVLTGKRFFLALGANDRRKNVGCVVRAFEALRTMRRRDADRRGDPAGHPYNDLTLVLVGANGIRPPQTDRSSHILRLAHPSDTSLATLMRHASAFLYPSWYEGFGLPLHEAARFGTPCIASTAGALPETAPTGTIFVPPLKPHLWTQTMETVLTHGEHHKSSTCLTDWTEAAEMVSEVGTTAPRSQQSSS